MIVQQRAMEGNEKTSGKVIPRDGGKVPGGECPGTGQKKNSDDWRRELKELRCKGAIKHEDYVDCMWQLDKYEHWQRAHRPTSEKGFMGHFCQWKEERDELADWDSDDDEEDEEEELHTEAQEAEKMCRAAEGNLAEEKTGVESLKGNLAEEKTRKGTLRLVHRGESGVESLKGNLAEEKTGVESLKGKWAEGKTSAAEEKKAHREASAAALEKYVKEQLAAQDVRDEQRGNDHGQYDAQDGHVGQGAAEDPKDTMEAKTDMWDKAQPKMKEAQCGKKEPDASQGHDDAVALGACLRQDDGGGHTAESADSNCDVVREQLAGDCDAVREQLAGDAAREQFALRKKGKEEKTGVESLKGNLGEEKTSVESLKGNWAEEKAGVESLKGNLAEEKTGVEPLKGNLKGEGAMLVQYEGMLAIVAVLKVVLVYIYIYICTERKKRRRGRERERESKRARLPSAL